MWTYNQKNGYCYSSIFNDVDTQDSAKYKCISAESSATLLTIKDEAELNFTNRNVFSKANTNWRIWIGAYYEECVLIILNILKRFHKTEFIHQLTQKLSS